MFNKKPLADNTRRPSTGAQAKIYSRDNVARYSERARQRRRGRTVRRVALIAVLGVLLSATTAAGLWFATIMGKLGDSNVITNNLRQILVDTNEAKDPFYVLLLGTDGRPGEDTYRADSIILARIDPTQKQATLISVPRDTKVVYKGETMKINACHTVGGAEAMVQAVNELCGVQISHYAEVSFDGMQSLIDSVGGIDINATDDVDDPEHLDIKITAGQQHMDGATALTYARCRYTYADGDYTRMRHQRQVLGALANQILNNFDATKIFGLVNSLSDMLVTDMSVQDIVSTVNATRGMDVEGIYSANLPSYADDSTMIDGVSYVFVYEDELKEIDGPASTPVRIPRAPTPWAFQTAPAPRSVTSTTIRPRTTHMAPRPRRVARTIPTIRATAPITTKSPPVTATATKPTTRVTRAYQPA